MHARGRKTWIATGVGLICGLGALLLEPALQDFESATWDARARWLASPGDPSIKIILLDQASLDWGEIEPRQWRWPWPREIYAVMLEYLSEAGARGIAFDVLITEPSAYGVEDDEALAAAIQSRTHIAVPAMPTQAEKGLTGWPDIARFRPEIDSSTSAEHHFDRAIWPIDRLLTATPVIGHVRATPDTDQVIRRVNPWLTVDQRPMPLLGLAPMLHEAPRALQPRTVTLPRDAEGRMILRYRAPRSNTSVAYDTYSAAAVIESALQKLNGESPALDADVFRDAWVFFGFSAPGLGDLRATPVAPVTPGVIVHATALDNALNHDALREPASLFTMLWAFSLAIAGALGIVHAGSAWRATVILGILSLLAPVISLLAYRGGWAWPMVMPQTAAWSAIGAMLMIVYATEGRQRRFIRRAFDRYLSPDVIERILEDPKRLELGGERRTLTIYFSDLQGFSTIAENMDPRDLTDLLNDYLSLMSKIVLEEGGTLDKYEGDAIIAFWGAPLDRPDHAARACRATLRCQMMLAEHRARLEARAKAPIAMRIGVHTGPVIVGNMGSYERFDYTVLGDAANLASRLEGANKVFGTGIMISEETWRAAQKDDPALIARQLGRIRVVGRQEPVAVYELLPPNQVALRDRFDKAHAHIADHQWPEVRSIFEQLTEDPAAQAWVKKIDEETANDPSWDGVWNLTSK